MTKIAFIKQLKQDFPNINDAQLNLFEIYKQFLRTENEKWNLTKLDSEELIYEKYFYTSIIPFLKIDLTNKKLLDIGSGSGIPGIVLKILAPTLQLTIIESNNKKAAFMQALCKILQFNDVEFIIDRAEVCAHEHIEQFDIVTSRAVSALPILLEMSCQFVKIGGLIIEPKSQQFMYELDDSLAMLDVFGLNTPTIIKHDEKNVSLQFIKSRRTQMCYPREWKVMIKDHKKVNMHE